MVPILLRLLPWPSRHRSLSCPRRRRGLAPPADPHLELLHGEVAVVRQRRDLRPLGGRVIQVQLVEKEPSVVDAAELLPPLGCYWLVDPVLVVVERLGADLQLEVGKLGEDDLVQVVSLQGEAFRVV